MGNVAILSRCTLLAFVAAGLARPSASFAADSVWHDAAHLWTFSDHQDPRGQAHLKTTGDVEVGAALPNAERAESTRHGGDGQIARFRGGYLTLANPDAGTIQVGNGGWTIVLRVRDPSGKWLGPIFGSYGGEQKVSFALGAVDGTKIPFEDRNINGGVQSTVAAALYGDERGPRAVRGNKAHLQFQWGAQTPNRDIHRKLLHNLARNGNGDIRGFPLEQEIRDGVMLIGFPLHVLGPTDWHDIVIRYTGPKVQLFTDGVLLDEEYPIGDTRVATAPLMFGARAIGEEIETGFAGEMDHVAVWRRALSEEEIANLSGGAQAVAARYSTYLGDFPSRQFQYFRPPSHNMKPGDCIPFFHDGRLHLFNCMVRRNQHSKWRGGHGAIELHHYSTADLRNWRWDPVAVPITEQWESWNGTGGIAVRDGLWHMFYPCPTDIPTIPKGGIQLATSRDGLAWEKQLPHPYLVGGDVDVVPNAEEGGYDMLRAGPIQPAPLPALAARTLVVWAQPSDSVSGNGAVASIVGDAARGPRATVTSIHYDAARRTWSLAASAKKASAAQPPAASGLVQLALVVDGERITLLCDGKKVDEAVNSQAAKLPAGAQVVLGVANPAMDSAPAGYFAGSIADARLYDRALSADELAELRPDQPSKTPPIVWYDFAGDQAVDRTGLVKYCDLVGSPKIADGRLVLDGYSYIYAGASMKTILRLFSRDLRAWEQRPGTVLVADVEAGVTTCPHQFKWNDWWYYFGGNSVWRSRHRYGPWLRHVPGRLDTTSVMKTGAFTGNRRLGAGFLADGNWGGTIVVRELAQQPNGSLTIGWVPEMIPAAGEAIDPKLSAATPSAIVKANAATLAASGKTVEEASIELPLNARLSFTVRPQAGVAEFGLRLRTSRDGQGGTDLVFNPADRTVEFTKKTDSAMRINSSPARLSKVAGLDQPFRVEMVFCHDVIDVEIAGRHTTVNRFWNPDGTHARFFAKGGSVEFGDVTVRPLAEPPPTFPVSEHRVN